MKAVCISCFNHYENRVRYIENFLISRGYEVKNITADFEHIEKKRRTIERKNEIFIHTMPYYNNLSLRRILSHFLFSKNAITKLNSFKPDLLYIIIPPNYLVKLASKYKKKYGVTLIYDLYDLWPESLPFVKKKKIFSLPLSYWAKLRDDFLFNADVVITECELYQSKLKSQLFGIKTDTLYLTKYDSKLNIKQDKLNCDLVNVCYLGSINNIIDIVLIKKLLQAINKIKPVNMYIIGDGESREQFIDIIQSTGIKVHFFGKIFNEQKKKEILTKCLFGLNIMKNTVCVGLTLKSIDYFEAGLPILNNIKADTAKIVENYEIGFNITDKNIEEVAMKVANLDLKRLLIMKDRTRQAFEKLFSHEAFNKKLEVILSDIVK
jgi:glycosyltransferase involved in cell wall biosynthesis